MIAKKLYNKTVNIVAHQLRMKDIKNERDKS